MAFLISIKRLSIAMVVLFCLLAIRHGDADEPTFEQANAVLTKYCAGCHNADDANGEFALDTFDALVKGSESGNALTPGSAASSRMVQMMRGKLDPTMPPADEATPSDDEIQIVADWIEAGARGPDGTSNVRHRLTTPKIETAVDYQPVTALAYSKNEELLAIARFGKLEIRDANGKKTIKTFEDLPGKVNSVSFLANDRLLVAGTGVAGLYGEAILMKVSDGTIVRRFRGHRDMVYSVAISPDEKWMATSGYDRKSVLWNVESEEPVRSFLGHNDAVFENVFDPTGELLVTASADATVKIWRVSDAQRLDTRGEPLKEQYTAAISPNGKWMVAGGEDNRIRKWKLVSRDVNQTNPLKIVRFAHESAVQLLRFSQDGKYLVSVGSDGAIKIWDSETLAQRHQFKNQSESVQALAMATNQVVIGRMDGTLEVLPWPAKMLADDSKPTSAEASESTSPEIAAVDTESFAEVEPNDTADDAMEIQVPAVVTGTINAGDRTDVDTFRFDSSRGQRWIIETRASRDKSPLDTRITVLNPGGEPVPRVLLRSVRDSYFTFRGKNSQQTGDFRIHNWEEMQLGQLLYCNGEVVKLFHYPRGPDSGYNVYPNFGNRHGMFDTTPVTHALHEPCFIVEPHSPGSEFPASGLPNFLLNYENDDDAQQELGSDSRLTFTAPEDGEYLVRVRDARDFQGDDFKYQLTIRREAPGFGIKSISGENPTVVRGSYKKIGVTIDRKDNFEGPVEIEIDSTPTGFAIKGPISIEENGLRAWFTLYASRNAVAPAEDSTPLTITATAMIHGVPVRKTKSLGKIKLNDERKLRVWLSHPAKEIPHFNQEGQPVFELYPGETITATVSVGRQGHDGLINFGKEEAALNLPFGVFVDNTGLNGVLIPAGEIERTIFLTAEPWVKPCERLIFLEAGEAGKPSSNPAVLRVLSK